MLGGDRWATARGGRGRPGQRRRVTAWNAGAPSAAVPHYNPAAWERSEVISAKIWNQDWPHDCIRVRDDSGQVFPRRLSDGQLLGAQFTTVAFPVKAFPNGIPGYQVERGPEPLSAEGTSSSPERSARAVGELDTVTLENEHLRVVLDCQQLHCPSH